MKDISPGIHASLAGTFGPSQNFKHTESQDAGAVKFWTVDLAPSGAAENYRQADGNTTDCIYGFCDQATIDRVGVKDIKAGCFFATKGGAVALYKDHHTAGVDISKAKFFYIAWLDKGPVTVVRNH